ncbi:MAG: ATP synthase F1 subunit gamma [Bacteriovoracaceae bacterium]|nr:ATP synthase F1 subunit gamma [Candidatus Brocadiales bacterium]MBL6988967.1 ATP synthase F1 subunit gamma [Bacteriovoracaceae bacterium]
MATLKDLKSRIKSTEGISQVTSAMKIVAANKFAKAKKNLDSCKAYNLEMDKTIRTVSALSEKYTHAYLEKNSSKKEILLIVSSNKGLCGSYNSSLARTVTSFLNNAKEPVEIYFIGKKVKEIIKSPSSNMYSFKGSEPSFLEIKDIALELGQLFLDKKISRINIAFNVFKTAMFFIPTIKQILPFTLSDWEIEHLKQETTCDFLYNPSVEEILDELIPQVYINMFYGCILDSLASEHGIRMTVMTLASNNCTEAIRLLTLKANKLRQAAITTELIEVISGAEFMNS